MSGPTHKYLLVPEDCPENTVILTSDESHEISRMKDLCTNLAHAYGGKIFIGQITMTYTNEEGLHECLH